MPDNKRQSYFLWALYWLLLTATALAYRPLLPVDETRYVTVAWEMWLRGDYLVPHLNGATYSHKPPLLFWLINAGWGIFGLNDWWPRLVAPLFGLACLYLTALTGRRLWPHSDAGLLAPFLLLGSYYWGVYTTLTMFDLIIAVWTLVGVNGLIDVWRGKPLRGWILFTLGVGLGVLTKGPVILVYLAPAALLAPYWAVDGRKINWAKWYMGAVLAICGGAAIALAWAIPAGYAGGEAYQNAIFWGQSAGRMVKSFAHREPFWWYFALLPALLLPWIIWPSLLVTLWQKFRSKFIAREVTNKDAGLRLALVWALSALLIFSAISGKRPHYLLPFFPAIALCSALFIDRIAYLAPLKGRWDILPPAIFSLLFGIVILAAPQIGDAMRQPELTNGVHPIWSLPLVAASLFLIIKPPTAGRNRIVALTALSTLFVITVHGVAKPRLQDAYDLKRVALYLAEAQKQGYEIGHWGKYHGQYGFLGRLEKPIEETGNGEIHQWLKKTPKGKIISYHKRLDVPEKPEFVHPFRKMTIAIWDRDTILKNPQAPNRR